MSPTAKKPTRRKQLGLSVEDYDRMLAAQNGHCALCPAVPKTRRLDVDHDHATGEVRALLCHRCNRALPSWVTTRWLMRAIDYLSHNKPGTIERAALAAVENDEPGQQSKTSEATETVASDGGKS